MDIILLKYAGIVLVFVAVFLFVMQFFPGEKEREIRRKTGLSGEREWGDDLALIKVFYPFILLLKPVFSLLPETLFHRMLKQWLVTAGFEDSVAPTEIISLQFILAVMLPLLLSSVMGPFGAVVTGVAAGLSLPVIWIYEKKKERQEAILRELPNIVDMLALIVEAGLDFNAAARRVCDQFKGESNPLVYELEMLLNNIRLGMTREQGLNKMAERIDMQDMHSFCSILIQSEKMGASIGQVLKDQAMKLRKERFMKVERMGAVATQKLLIPMVIFVFPLIFFVVLGPILLKFLY
jgi:tight adherence protein C